MADFGSLWVGRPLSNIEKTCLASFVYHGHNMFLYVYDDMLEVPEGVIKRNARDIIPEDKIFKIDNSYGPFADMFRYKMIQRTGLIWTDTDNICLKSDWNFPKYTFGLQGGGHELVANGLLKAPSDSRMISELVDISQSFDKTQIKWGEIGPQLLTSRIQKHKLNKFIQDPHVFYPVNYWEWKMIFDPRSADQVFELARKSHTLQIWNQMLNREDFDNNNFKSGSVMDYYYKKYILGQHEDKNNRYSSLLY